MNRLTNVFLLVFFGLFFNSWAQKSGGRAAHGRAAARARIAGISLQQWQKNTGNQVKQSIAKIIGNRPVDELNGFQKRRITNYQRRLANRLPDFDGQIDLGTYYPAGEGSPVRYRSPNTGKVYKPKQMVRILKVMPDTSIKYDYEEKIVLINLGPANLDLTGWKIVDPGTTKKLDGYKFNGRTLEITVTSMFNNDGDDISLIDNSNYKQDEFTYTKSQVFEDTWIIRKNTIKTFK